LGVIKIKILNYSLKFQFIINKYMLIGDWGLGIGDWAQSPIPNPQSPIPNPQSPIPKYFNYKEIN
jgi:hypothetical protein